ncbi:lipoate--protein ligase [Streptococcus penaeicida]|uniref:Lipoate--protein ligase n=2 Tax=Streptococcus penaeicida TaxID=1765960 RepID=A0A2N8LCT8_9STRE|nr:lipoate--protein ligase [Streptococcus penaeicida]
MKSLRDFSNLPIKTIIQDRHTNDIDHALVYSQELLEEVNDNPNQFLVHYWPLEKTVILGLLDQQLPNLEKGISFIKEQGYQVAVRNIGGLAVVADSGILNFSICLPINQNNFRISDGYELMVELIRKTLAPFGKTIEAYQIDNSYCPGKFDLSIDGQKFAGIAQRRKKDALLVSIYLSVNGNQNQRGRLISDFYQEAGAQSSSISYPIVEPEVMANLSQLLESDLRIEKVITMIEKSFSDLGFMKVRE